MEKDKKYLNIPVQMLKELHMDSKKFFRDSFDVGIYLYSRTLTGSEKKRYKDAANFLGIEQGRIGIDNAEGVLSQIPTNYPTTGIEKGMLFDYYNNYKDEFQIICLAAFLAIRSILGKKPYVKTNKAFIHARMFGYATVQDMPEELTPLQKKYKICYHMDKVITELQLNWYLKTLWNHNRGFYLSFDLTLKELAQIIDDDKYKYKKRKLREEKRKAINSVRG